MIVWYMDVNDGEGPVYFATKKECADACKEHIDWLTQDAGEDAVITPADFCDIDIKPQKMVVGPGKKGLVRALNSD